MSTVFDFIIVFLPLFSQAHPELGHIWDIGQHLWNRNFVAVYPLLSQDWSDDIKPLMDMLTGTIAYL